MASSAAEFHASVDTLFLYLENHLVANSINQSFPGDSDSRESTWNAGDLGSVTGSVKSPGEENRNSLQYSFLENSMERGAWWAIVHGVAKSQTWPSDKTLSHAHYIEPPGKITELIRRQRERNAMWVRAFIIVFEGVNGWARVDGQWPWV